MCSSECNAVLLLLLLSHSSEPARHTAAKGKHHLYLRCRCQVALNVIFRDSLFVACSPNIYLRECPPWLLVCTPQTSPLAQPMTGTCSSNTPGPPFRLSPRKLQLLGSDSAEPVCLLTDRGRAHCSWWLLPRSLLPGGFCLCPRSASTPLSQPTGPVGTGQKQALADAKGLAQPKCLAV